MSFPTTLATPTEKESILDALYRATIGLDTNDRALFTSAWSTSTSTPPRFEMVGLATHTGIEALTSNLLNTIGPLETTHFISNARINEIKDNKASMTTYALAQHYRAGEGMKPNTERLLSGAMYFIDLVKEGDSWRMRDWRMKLVWTEGNMDIVMGK